VSAGTSTFSYSDIAIVEGADAVKVEATKNGLDWVELDKHDASLFPEWQSILSSGGDATSAAFKTHAFDLKNKFAAGDVLLFRLKMETNATVNAWGWVLDWVAIQEEPVGIEPTNSTNDLSVYPSPSAGNFRVGYNLKNPSMVSVIVTDMYGREVISRNLGTKNAGVHSESFDLQGRENGTYIVLLNTVEGRKAFKITLLR
jgi:hypothetical protein